MEFTLTMIAALPLSSAANAVMFPDGSFVSGRCVLQSDGSYTGG